MSAFTHWVPCFQMKGGRIAFPLPSLPPWHTQSTRQRGKKSQRKEQELGLSFPLTSSSPLLLFMKIPGSPENYFPRCPEGRGRHSWLSDWQPQCSFWIFFSKLEANAQEDGALALVNSDAGSQWRGKRARVRRKMALSGKQQNKRVWATGRRWKQLSAPGHQLIS
jgi:hypothetical protein